MDLEISYPQYMSCLCSRISLQLLNTGLKSIPHHLREAKQWSKEERVHIDRLIGDLNFGTVYHNCEITGELLQPLLDAYNLKIGDDLSCQNVLKVSSHYWID